MLCWRFSRRLGAGWRFCRNTDKHQLNDSEDHHLTLLIFFHERMNYRCLIIVQLAEIQGSVFLIFTFAYTIFRCVILTNVLYTYRTSYSSVVCSIDEGKMLKSSVLDSIPPESLMMAQQRPKHVAKTNK
jgi:hypothetical protein